MDSNHTNHRGNPTSFLLGDLYLDLLSFRYRTCQPGGDDLGMAISRLEDGHATLTTDESVEKVLEIYRPGRNPEPKSEAEEAAGSNRGRSVIFINDFSGSPFAMHTLIANTSQSSTTLAITRADGEAETSISWKHYKRL